MEWNEPLVAKTGGPCRSHEVSGRPPRPMTENPDGIANVRKFFLTATFRVLMHQNHNIMAAINIATVVTATTVFPRIELVWPFITLVSDAMIRIPKSKNGASTPLITAVQ